VDASCVITYVLRESLPRCDLAWPYCIGKAFGIAHDRVITAPVIVLQMSTPNLNMKSVSVFVSLRCAIPKTKEIIMKKM